MTRKAVLLHMLLLSTLPAFSVSQDIPKDHCDEEDESAVLLLQHRSSISKKPIDVSASAGLSAVGRALNENVAEALSDEEWSCFTEVYTKLSEENDECKGQCGSSVMTSLNSTQILRYIDHVRKPHVTSVCETGFDTGKSAALWLCVNLNLTLYSFDLEFPNKSLEAITTKFGERFVYYEGDSMETLKRFAAQPEPPSCDVMIMDGGHYDPVPESDLMNFAKIAAKAPEIKHKVLVDEVFYLNGPDDACCPDVTKLVQNMTDLGAFDSNSSRCFSRNTNEWGEIVSDSRAFEVTTEGLQEMKYVESLYGGFCELVFTKEFLASVLS